MFSLYTYFDKPHLLPLMHLHRSNTRSARYIQYGKKNEDVISTASILVLGNKFNSITVLKFQGIKYRIHPRAGKTQSGARARVGNIILRGEKMPVGL